VNGASGSNAIQIENSDDANRGGRLLATGSAASGVFQINSTSGGYGITFGIDGNEAVRVDTSRRLLVGTSSARSNVYVGGSPTTPSIQSETSGSTYNNGASLLTYSAVNYAPILTLGTSNSDTAGTNAAVGINHVLGFINFVGNDGTNFRSGAFISAAVDGSVSTGDLPTRLVFSTTADGASSPTERMRITSTGQVRLAGAGITFNGDTATANELDDYEEGTWTPILADAVTGGNTAASYTLNSGTYTKVGNLVRVRCNIVFPVTTGMTAGNQAHIRGLPFTSNGTYQAEGAVFLRDITFPAGRTFASAWVNAGKTTAQIVAQGSGVGEEYLLVSGIASGVALISFTLTYTV
jgi:hypothetical protein